MLTSPKVSSLNAVTSHFYYFRSVFQYTLVDGSKYGICIVNMWYSCVKRTVVFLCFCFLSKSSCAWPSQQTIVLVKSQTGDNAVAWASEHRASSFVLNVLFVDVVQRLNSCRLFACITVVAFFLSRCTVTQDACLRTQPVEMNHSKLQERKLLVALVARNSIVITDRYKYLLFRRQTV